MRRAVLAMMAGAVLFGAAMSAETLPVSAKAWLTQRLIDRAWTQTLRGEADARPWPWMESAPVAKLSVPRLGKEFVVLKGNSGDVLAFAPGWHDGTDLPGRDGISLISAHRDTHFAFLQSLEIGDVVNVETPEGGLAVYRVEDLESVTEAEIQVRQEPPESVLLLSTSYPFANWQKGEAMRFVAVARRIREPSSVQIAALEKGKFEI